MVCQDLSIMGLNATLIDYMIFPTTCFYYTYAVILFGLFALFTFLLHNRERELNVKSDIISSLAVSASATLFLGLIATLVKSSGGIPLLQRDILLYMVAIWIALVTIWFWKR